MQAGCRPPSVTATCCSGMVCPIGNATTMAQTTVHHVFVTGSYADSSRAGCMQDLGGGPPMALPPCGSWTFRLQLPTGHCSLPQVSTTMRSTASLRL